MCIPGSCSALSQKTMSGNVNNYFTFFLSFILLYLLTLLEQIFFKISLDIGYVTEILMTAKLSIFFLLPTFFYQCISGSCTYFIHYLINFASYYKYSIWQLYHICNNHSNLIWMIFSYVYINLCWPFLAKCYLLTPIPPLHTLLEIL